MPSAKWEVASISPARLALLGFGGVGQALARRLPESELGLEVTSVTDTTGTIVDEEGLDLGDLLATKQETDAVVDAEGTVEDWSASQAAALAPADIVVQLTPSDLEAPEDGLSQITAALGAARSVVTAAKDALACCPEAIAAAREQAQGAHASEPADARSAAGGPWLCSSASVGGSTPVLELLDGAFAGDELVRITGVLNGSTTAILSQMEDGDPFGAAIDAAREAGLLEADAKADLAGHDAAAKAAILHQRAFGSNLRLEDVPTKGITELGPAACQEAGRRGFAVRLVARVDASGACVRPIDLPQDDPLVGDGPRAAVRLTFAQAGEIVLQGPGAGPDETAGAVLSDILALVEGPSSTQASSKAQAARDLASPPPA